MKLEKTWMGICVWVIYLVGMIFAIGVTGFVSGLFPLYDRYYVAGGAAIAVILAAVLLGLILNMIIQKIVEPSRIDQYEKPLWLEIIMPVAIMAAAFFALGYSSSIVKDFTGNIDLYDSAVVAASGQDIQLTCFADKAYVAFLKLFMGFLGNSLSTAYTLHIVLRVMLILFLYISLRIVLGMIPAFAGCMAVILIPSFGYSLKSVNSSQLTSTAIFFLLMVTVLYVYGFTKECSIHWYYKLISIIYGAFLGFMIYFDAASAAVITFLIAAWVLSDMYGETIGICVNEIIVLISGVLAFGGMLIYEGGTDNIPDTYYRWTWRFYGYNDNAWLLMSKGSQYNTYLALGLLVFAFIPAVLFFIKRCTKTSVFIAFSILGLVSSVLLGDTVANSEVMVISFVVILICCGVAAMIHVKEYEPVVHAKKDEEEELEEEPEDEDSEIEQVESESEDSEIEQVEAEDEEPEIEQVESESEDSEIEQVEAEDEESEVEQVEAENEEPEIEQEESESEPEQVIPRYVPEGMVLPMGEEDEESLVPNFNMNRPEMEDIGILSVGGAAIEAANEEPSAQEMPEEEEASEDEDIALEEASIPKKDDFDLNIAPGDDFDI